ncbi:hypothetical protein I302_104391 [Kwoniella bestiolae CBS 10118]|uniref:RING-type domain-containing protein n=1 Tax=Kwoniella bestiolae CBS 10118 TaxID=1296100 RepID=A0A1B9GB48_9TREE|nr:hypothetical protein I302_03097 [Kwoniella bestiolae CBS 10118]OCF28245.1 hypothetical protein I302_03097 [Kwoniella bestiolae CBS 10118]
MPGKSPRPSRAAKSRAIRRIDKAIPKEKKYQRRRKKEDKERKALRERYRQSAKYTKGKREAEQEHRLMDDDSATEEEEDKARTKKEESIPFECIICSDEIPDILQRAVQEGKGGVDGGLVLWSCDLRDCGALFCISCAVRYISPPLPPVIHPGQTTCPVCRREWDLERLREQARAYDPTLMSEG